MLKNVKTINLIKIISGSIGAVAIAAGIGLGYHYSNASNPYNNFYKRPTNFGDSSLQLSYQAAVRNGADVLVGTGFTHNSIMSTINKNSEFQHTGFLGVDVNFTGVNGWNVATVNFRTEQSGFLAAIVSAEYLNQNQDFFLDNKDDVLSYSAWGGMPGQSVDSYLSGFQQGIIYFNEKILPLLKQNNVKTDEGHNYQEIYLAFPNKFYAGGFGIGDANDIIDVIATGNCLLMNPNGTKLPSERHVRPKIVFPVAGPQTATMVNKVYVDHLRMAVVGVDTPMETDPMTTKNFDFKNNKYPKINGQACRSIIPFSAVKDMKNATAGILNNIVNGTVRESSNGYGGLGWYSVGDIKNQGAGISEDGYQSLVNVMVKAHLLDKEHATYDGAKEYFSNTYDISDAKNLTCDVIEGKNGESHQYIPLRSSGLLIEKKPNETDMEFETRKVQFEKNCDVFSQFLGNKMTALKNKDNKSEFQNSVKIVLSTPTSILFDHSFSESGYLSLCKFYEDQGCPIPSIK